MRIFWLGRVKSRKLGGKGTEHVGVRGVGDQGAGGLLTSRVRRNRLRNPNQGGNPGRRNQGKKVSSFTKKERTSFNTMDVVDKDTLSTFTGGQIMGEVSPKKVNGGRD